MIRLISKRNRVYLDPDHDPPIVRKYFSEEADCVRELQMYAHLSGCVPIPRLLESGQLYMAAEYLPYQNYLDVLEQQEQSGLSIQPWEQLLQWLKNCWQCAGVLPSDGNLRNFLGNEVGNETCGVDLEEYRSRSFHECAADFWVQLRDYDPQGTQIKLELLRYWRQQTGISEDDIKKAYSRLIAKRKRFS